MIEILDEFIDSAFMDMLSYCTYGILVGFGLGAICLCIGAVCLIIYRPLRG